MTGRVGAILGEAVGEFIQRGDDERRLDAPGVENLRLRSPDPGSIKPGSVRTDNVPGVARDEPAWIRPSACGATGVGIDGRCRLERAHVIDADNAIKQRAETGIAQQCINVCGGAIRESKETMPSRTEPSKCRRRVRKRRKPLGGFHQSARRRNVYLETLCQ